MSPPKVSLSGKEPLKSIDLADEPQEKSDALEFPSVINIETDRRARVLRNQRKEKRCRVIVCGVAMVILVTVAAVGTLALVQRLRHHHRGQWKCGGPEHINENVKVDHDNQLIYASHDHDENTNTPAMEFLHEYNRNLVAYKDMEQTVCYIDRLDETFYDGYERWESYENDDREAKALKVISEQPIEVEVLKHIGDIHIYAHCENAQSYWVMEIEEEEITEDMKIIRV